uniref:Uncharacterized protein n=1 Tax=Octopus bimaculoides TaxID=37653 RepID=A0A0L8HK81_OCTBM
MEQLLFYMSIFIHLFTPIWYLYNHTPPMLLVHSECTYLNITKYIYGCRRTEIVKWVCMLVLFLVFSKLNMKIVFLYTTPVCSPQFQCTQIYMHT